MIAEADLSSVVDRAAVDCFNVAAGHGAAEMLSGSSHLESDVGNDVLLHVPFREHVKLNALLLRFAGGRPSSERPSLVRLYVDKPNLQLRDAAAGRIRPIQEILLEGAAAAAAEEEEGSKLQQQRVQLQYVRLQNVSSVAVYLRSAGERLSLGGLSLLGAPRSGVGLNIAEWQSTLEKQKQQQQ